MELSGARQIRISSVTKELPEELIRTEILARIPVKSLARFKSVCKSWLSVFSSDPQFAKELYRRNRNDHDCIVADTSVHLVILSRYSDKFSFRGDGAYKLIGSVNGLVCVSRGNRVSLWNPAMYLSKEFDISPYYYLRMNIIGFGFDPASNDYKVVLCYESYPPFHPNCVVYSSNSGTWIDQQHVPSKFKKSVTPTTMVKDCPYWTCSTRYEYKTSLAALKFDTTSNEFKLLAEFSCDVTSDHDNTFTFVNMKDLLAVMVCEPSPVSKLDVYSLDEEKGCGGVWSKMYSVQNWCFEHPRNPAQAPIACQGFRNGDEIVFHELGRIYRYDHKTKTLEGIPCPILSPFKGCFAFPYMPSLISLPGMTSAYSETHKSATPMD